MMGSYLITINGNPFMVVYGTEDDAKLFTKREGYEFMQIPTTTVMYQPKEAKRGA